MSEQTDFYGPNLGYVLELYERYREAPESVDGETREFFERWGPPKAPSTNGHTVTAAGVETAVGAAKYIRSIRDFGHSAARLDPLGTEPSGDPTLDPAFHGITEEDLEALPSSVVGGPLAERTATAREAVEELKGIYCSTTGYDFGHIHLPQERFWLRDAVEGGWFRKRLRGKEAKRLLRRLTRIENLERFLHRTFLGQKRFSIEGLDMLVPVINTIVRNASDTGTPEAVLGMAHRGRLNVMAHVLDKPYSRIFGEFMQPEKGESSADSELSGAGWTGDVKYHLGRRGFYLEDGEEDARIFVNLAPNPSHLEFVDPVVEGMARAAQERRARPGDPEQDTDASLPILLHGDAAFPGEGVAAETLNLSRLRGYHTGGTIHIITNNQLGFTTEAAESRSTAYASDLAKGFEIPVVHVNADDPEACLAAARMAYAYRQRFGKDFMIDLIGYRRFGHNEGDEPSYTQPVMYEAIRSHPTVRQIWAEELQRRGEIDPTEADELSREIYSRMETLYNTPQEVDESPAFTNEPRTPLQEIPQTAVSEQRLRTLNEGLLTLPEGFTPDSKLYRLLRKNRGDLEHIDWAHAESLAFASLLEDGYPVRLTGQDTERGTFSQRHAALYDVKTGERHVPLQSLKEARAPFSVYNSPLSETAVLGFEYGYTINVERTLVLWEAQYGDFTNVAQPIVDQFIVSGQAKWGQTSNLVLLLPHGYEGQGPEHSSARLERFLQLAAHENIRVANLTTAAQYFHLLRAQAMLVDYQRPLVLMSPKSLLRHPLAASTLEGLSQEGFHPVIDDERAAGREEEIERLVLCSGRFFTELSGSREREEAHGTALGRVELLYPFPEEWVREMIERYPNLREIIWTQEEPMNMGAWTFIEPRLRELAGDTPLYYVGKPSRPSPAQGSIRFHRAEHAQIVAEAFAPVDKVKRIGGREVRHAG